MGLFSRTNNGANGQDDFDEIDLPTSNDLKGGMFTSEESNVAPPSPAPARRAAPAIKGTYGIEDAIKLMRSLPRDNNEVVVTVVKKTLESTSIKVNDIVSDANQKEARIRNQHKTLEEEIKELQDQIAQRNQQISDLLHDLKETTDVRQRLQLAMELDGESVPAAQPQQAVEQQVAGPIDDDQHAGVVQPRPASNNPNSNPNADPNMRRRMQQRNNPPH